MPDPASQPSAIQKVWIEEGCISCSLCQDICPEVFEVPDGEDCVIRPEAGTHFRDKAEGILDAAADCPVEVIKYSHSHSRSSGPAEGSGEAGA